MINIWHGDSGILTPLWARRFISFRELMNQLLLSNKSDPPAADWNVMFSVSCRHWLVFLRENLSFCLGTVAVFLKTSVRITLKGGYMQVPRNAIESYLPSDKDLLSILSKRTSNKCIIGVSSEF